MSRDPSEGPARVGDIVGSFLEKKGLKAQVERAGIVEEWPGVVGERIAQVTRARAVSDETLFVEVRSSAWMSELDFMKEEILERLNERSSGAPIAKLVFLLAGS